MTFSEQIRAIRRNKLLSQESFAKEIGVSFATVNRWETGRCKPNLKTIRIINEYCKREGLSIELMETIEGRIK